MLPLAASLAHPIKRTYEELLERVPHTIRTFGKTPNKNLHPNRSSEVIPFIQKSLDTMRDGQTIHLGCHLKPYMDVMVYIARIPTTSTTEQTYLEDERISGDIL